MSDEAHPHEIIIIKRHAGGHDEGHHGGAWKIAYADFVTAMMAFFLVMWLISANDKTKATIARYFNPVLLVDSTSQPPGLSDPKDKSSSTAAKGANPPPEAQESKDAASARATAPAKEPLPSRNPLPASEQPAPRETRPVGEEGRKDDAALFKDPYAVLAEIAAKDAPSPSLVTAKAPKDGVKGGSGTAATAAGHGGEAFRDPFEPISPKSAGTLDGAAESGRPEGPPAPPEVPTGRAAAAPEAPAGPVPADPQARAAELKSRIDALLKAGAAGAGPEPRIEVKATPEGLLIGLTDDARFSMFASASAEPSPRAVTLMERIGKLLKDNRGGVVIRGYTDSRKFRSDTYDNWRLSSARADVAHYMLVRGGLDDARFERVEGYADRQPRDPKDPEGPENRRIEILLREAP